MLNRKRIDELIRPLDPVPTGMTARLVPLDRVDAVLFDIYGTLFISGSGDIGTAKKQRPNHDRLVSLARSFGVTIPPGELPLRLMAAIEKQHEALRRQGVDCPEVEIDRIWMSVLGCDDEEQVRRFAAEYEMVVNPVYPMPHLERLLQICRGRGLVMGVISNAQFFTPRLFEWLLGRDMETLGFDPELLFFSYQHQRAKPSLFLFEAAAARLDMKGVSPASALYVGNDMLNDIWPAHTIGFTTALFAGDRRSLRLRPGDPRCDQLTPDITVTDLGQLADLLTAPGRRPAR